jgi:formylglycine-generating enzyme required for sulfatase activity
VKNGDETDVDCGGTKTGAPKCAAGKTCATHADCLSDGCDYNKKCADGKSCTQHFGGDTCGPTGAQESCCKSLDVPLPSGTVKLDKYDITAGRFRQFVERTGGNIRAWIKANRPAWWETGWDDLVPTQLDDGNYISHDGVAQEVGPGLFFKSGAGNAGCEVHSYGARTYRLSDKINTERFTDGQHYTQDELDEKALQCTTFFMFSAFCAWDGGRLPSYAELNYAWNKGTPASYNYPWGNTPNPAGWNDSWGSLAEAQMNGTVKPVGGDQSYASYWYNWWSPATRVCAADDSWCDYSVHVAPPGRFPKGNGPFGHADLAGNLLNMTNQIGGTAGTAVDNREVVWFRNGTWQGHAIPFYQSAQNPLPSWKSLSKYWATGARCAR